MVQFDLEKFLRVLERFAQHLDNLREKRAAKAVRSVAKLSKAFIKK